MIKFNSTVALTDTSMYHISHLYDDGDGHDVACYDHYEPSRQVAPLFLEPNTDDSQQWLLWLVESCLESKIDLINHHFAHCLECEDKANGICNYLGVSYTVFSIKLLFILSSSFHILVMMNSDL